VAPFSRIVKCGTVAKASSGLIPQLFWIRVLTKSKEQWHRNKKALRDLTEGLGICFTEIKRISPPVAGAAYTCTYNRDDKYVF